MEQRRPRVLVVDDNRDAADSLVMLLEVLGAEARAAYAADAALRAAAEFRPDCVISDLHMPGMDGYRLAIELRAEAKFKNALFVAVSAAPDVVKLKAAGFDRHLVKPAEIDHILEVLAESQAMIERLQQLEQAVAEQATVVGEVRDLMREMKADVREIKEELREVREEVKELKDDHAS